jgi:hypothetical protein
LIHKYNKDIDTKEDHVLLKVFNEISKKSVDQNQNLVDGKLNEFVSDLLQKPEYDLSLDMINRVSKNERLIRTLVDIVSENNVPKKEMKVLEINFNKNIFAEEIDNHLASAAIYPIDVDYNIAVKSTSNVKEDVRKSFKVTEWDVEKSSFPVDVTLANLVVFNDSQDLWDLSLADFLQELYDCISSKGFLISVFRYRLTEPELALNALKGKNNVNERDLIKRINDFAKEAESVGFSVISSKSDSIGTTALLLRKIATKEPQLPDDKNVIEINDKTEQWFETIKQKLLDQKESERNDEELWLIANDSSKNGIVGLINCLRLEPGGETIRCLFNCDNTPVNFKDKPFYNVLANDLAVNVLRDGQLGTYRHLNLPKDYDQIQSNEYFLNNGLNRDLSSLQWYDMKNLNRKTTGYDIQNRETKYVNCNIYSAGLNFKDVMFATGIAFELNIIYD